MTNCKMTSRLTSRAARLILTIAVAALAGSCIKANYDLGSEYLAIDQQFDIFTATFPLEDISMEPADSLSGYSQTRLAVGAIRDDDFGLVRRAAAITLVPVYDSLDFGTNPKFKSFHMVLCRDTVSVAKDEDAGIHQGLNIYELTESLEKSFDINGELKHGTKRITKGVPVFNGSQDTVGIYFTREFGEKYLTITNDDFKDLSTYTSKFPGIYLETDDPVGDGGRINLFKVQLQYDASSYMINGNYAILAFNSTYENVAKDTAFIFYFSPNAKYDVDSLIYNATGSLPQYGLNVAYHESAAKKGPAADRILVEGGGGLKPVLSAAEIRSKLIAEISKHGNPEEAAINRASVKLPFIFPDDYKEMVRYPEILSPTCRIRTEDGVSFASITDSSDSNEDQGDVNRSLLVYAPDITYHTQSLLGLKDLDKISNYDVWQLIMSNEVHTTKKSAAEQDQDNEYLNMMMYSSYYNNMYGGYGGYGYGGYGYGGYGYGGYGNYYSNYYSYYLMQQMYGSNSTSSTVKQLDIYRYYHAILRGPSDPVAHPTMSVTYALPRNAE